MDSVTKRLDVTRHLERITRVREAGIAVGGYFVLGLDEDTPQTFEQTFDFIHESRIALPVLNLLLPAPGTPVFEKLRRQGRLRVENPEALLRNNERYATASSHCLYRPKRISPEEAETAFLELYGQLTTFREITWRCLRHGPLLDAILLGLNLEMRKQYLAMRAGIRHRQPGNAALCKSYATTTTRPRSPSAPATVAPDFAVPKIVANTLRAH